MTRPVHGQCATCEHWDPQWPEHRLGECRRLATVESLARITNGIGHEYLCTDSIFGCIQYEIASAEQLAERAEDGIIEVEP
jgi:hypothetical protein